MNRKFKRHRKKLKTLTSIVTFLLIASCGMFDSGELWRDGNYVVAWLDDGHAFLAYGKPEDAYYELVGKSVVAVGSNEKYVIVEQRDLISKKLVYFIVDKEIEKHNGEGRYSFSQYKAVTGPYLKTEFDIIKREKTLPDFSSEF